MKLDLEDLISLSSEGFKSFSAPARKQISTFLIAQLDTDGGFKNRAGNSDLYYTYFGILSFLSAEIPVPSSTLDYLERKSKVRNLDMVHLSVLIQSIRATENLPNAGKKRTDRYDKLFERLEFFRSDDGGYRVSENLQEGTLYGIYLAFFAYNSCNLRIPQIKKIPTFITSVTQEDGACSNCPSNSFGTSTTSSAALLLQECISGTHNAKTARWLESCISEGGGTKVSPLAPIPDMLSTAATLYALYKTNCVMRKNVIENNLRFIKSLKIANGAFSGSSNDRTADLEYTYYALFSTGISSRILSIRS